MGGCFSRKAIRESRPRQEQQLPVFRAQHNGREKERPAERNGARRKTEPPKRPTPERKQSRIPAANLRENKSHSLPLGKRTNFGYEKNFKAKYTLGKLLGHGQFGYTYVAIEKSTGNKVAVKCIEKKQMTLPISVEDVKREVRILRTLSGHENVVQFYAAFEDDDMVYIAMELCEGGELLDRILAK
jgi:calcium-dependent protein kinase